MNCECIYYSKYATKEDLAVLAQRVKEIGEEVELYPLAISRIDEKLKVCEDYNGWGKTMNIQKWSAVLFVGGKLHNMNPIRIGHRVYKPWHPMEEPYFTDLQTFDEED